MEPEGTPKAASLSALLADLARLPEGSDAEAWLPDLGPGATVGRFELQRELGRGSFGVVFEARDTELRRTVAVKVVRAGRADAGGEQLRREAEAIAHLTHPNLVTLFDAGLCGHGPYLVLELLRGRTLAARLHDGPLAAADALRVAVEVARGLAHAHARGVVHRDLKPSNVFLCDDGAVKILDFGLAHAFGRRRLEGGTPDYMAPEQWRGAPEDERTDVFALGVMLYRMLAGELPFPPDKGRSITSPAPAPRLEVPGLPALGEALAAMLAKDPVERPRDAAAALAALEAARPEGATGSRSTTGAVRIRRRSRQRAVLAAGGAALALALGAAALWGRGGGAEAPPSVAVLPFADLSPARDQEYFSDGLAEEILNALAQVDGLRVTGRTSSFSYKGKNEDLRAIGKALGVATVLEGSVRRDGQRIRVTAQLVKAADGYHLWSQTFDREASGVFAVQDEIAAAVVEALRVRLLAGKAPSTREHRTGDPEVYNQYLLGRQYERRINTEDNRLAVRAYEQALARDPSYAPAWAGLATAVYWGFANTAESAAALAAAQARALEAAERAVGLGPDLPDAWAARGFLRANVRWDWQGGLADLQRALALNPGLAETHRVLARDLLLPLGRVAEARSAAEKAVQLDPLLASAWSTAAAVAIVEGRHPEARTAARRSMELQPKQDSGPGFLATLELLDGQAAAALAACERMNDDVFRLQYRALALHDLGRRAEAQAALDALLAEHGHDGPFNIASVHAWRGEKDQAFAWLERALAVHDGALLDLPFDPVLRSLHGDPRFAPLLARMGLPAR